MAMKARMKGGPRNTCTSPQVMVKGIEGGLWPTPTVLDTVERKGMRPSRSATNRKTGYLSGMVIFPTPTVPSGGGTARSGDRHDEVPSLQGMASKGMWPTPKSSASGPDFARENRPDSGGDDLATAVARETFPSPAERDWRSGTGRVDNGHTPQLPEKVGRQLNADWVEWLMGWPIGWTSLEPLSADAIWDWMTPGWWDEEPPIPRVMRDSPKRKQRLMALGNGQVPLCAATAFLLLTGEVDE